VVLPRGGPSICWRLAESSRQESVPFGGLLPLVAQSAEGYSRAMNLRLFPLLGIPLGLLLPAAAHGQVVPALVAPLQSVAPGQIVPSLAAIGVYAPSPAAAGVYGPSAAQAGVYEPSAAIAGGYAPSAAAAGSYAPSRAAAGAYGVPQNVQGRIAGFDGDYQVNVNDQNGNLVVVQLHPGTPVCPIGLVLAPGMVVSVVGYGAGGEFLANEIDTPYTLAGGVPSYAGQPWTYFGPTIGLTYFFGPTAWWQTPGYFGNRSGFHGGHLHVRGREVIAPAVFGGYDGHHAGSSAPVAVAGRKSGVVVRRR
jgi:hypothetical protein